MSATATSVARRTRLLQVGLSLIAVRVIDDNFLHPRPGTGVTDHLVSGLVPLAVLGLAAAALPRLRAGAGAALALVLGVLGLATGVEAVYYSREVGLSAGDVSGWLALPASLLLLGVAVETLWRSRRTGGRRGYRYLRRGLLAAGAFATFAIVLFPVLISYVESHTARAVVPPNELGVHYEDVSFTTADRLRLEGWYVPSSNGAAVIAFPGRKGPQRHARMLARHGYGVLLFDRRGEGASDGDPNAFGWGGDADVKAAIAYLQHRPDVDPARIGGIGLSVGGELMLETAAETDALAAVVSEGAGARTAGEELDSEMPAIDRWLAALSYGARDASLAVFTNTMPPKHLKTLVPRIAPRPLLLIAAPNSPNGEKLNRVYVRAAHAPKALWEIPEAVHTGGIEARPAEYERRVVGFFDEAMGSSKN